MTAATGRYVRLQARYRGRLGVEVGIFVAVDHLRRAGRLSVEEEQLYFDIDDWFNENLPNPPFYEDGNTVGAVTWFKRGEATTTMLERLQPLQDLLDRHGVEYELAESEDPGLVIYQDEYQVGVIPHRRREPSPLPVGTVLGPTTAGSKRKFGKRAATDASTTRGQDDVLFEPG
ncbi:MAG TPA: hypothetical protein VE990_19170 [Acidimicrobiales bacterium]|nr:hypothetical protein [Acidimicrobiales bacterium]